MTLKRTRHALTYKNAERGTKDNHTFIRLPTWDTQTVVYRNGKTLYMETPFERFEWTPTKTERQSRRWELWQS